MPSSWSYSEETATRGRKREERDKVGFRKTLEMEMGLVLGVREREEEKHFGEDAG